MATFRNKPARPRPSSHLDLGNQLFQRGDAIGAATAYRHHTLQHPADKNGHYNLAVTLGSANQVDAAIGSYCRAIEIDPGYPEALNNLGILLHGRGDLEAAKLCYAQALASRPDYEDAHYNYATAESDCGNLTESVVQFSRLLKRNPRRANAWNNLGKACLALRNPSDALKAFRIALELDPDLVTASWNMATAQLTLGNLKEGWQTFDFRGRQRHSALLRWDGQNLAGSRILIHAEQGLGDTIQFARYCKLVKNSGAHVTLEAHPPLVELLSSCEGIDTILPLGADLPGFNCQIPLMSLPGIFGTTLDSIPAAVPYLSVETSLIEKWRKRLATPEGNLSVGLVWAGNTKHPHDRYRSIPPSLFAALGQPKGVSFYSLQQKAKVSEITGMYPVTFSGVFDQLTFSETAAIVSNLDLVISVDTSVTHLAGALARPVWTLLPYAPDWRWMLDRADTPWYPTMRLFRQSRLNEWPEVIEQVATELRALATHQSYSTRQVQTSDLQCHQ